MATVNIALCDDEAEKGKQIDTCVENWLTVHEKDYTKQIFSSSRGLLYEIEDGRNFDLLLLDIEMPDLDGMELTERIKKYLPDVLIIFITSHEKYVYESFKVQPFRFIPKKYLEKMLPSALEDAFIYLEKCLDKYFFAENQGGLEKIPTKSITHIWHKEKYAYIEKTNGERTKVRKTLKQVYEELPKEDFVWIDRGCICNLLQVSKINNGDIVLTDGTRLQVSRDRLTEVKTALRKYWKGRDNKK